MAAVQAAKKGTGAKLVILLVIIVVVLSAVGVGFYLMHTANVKERAMIEAKRRHADAIKQRNQEILRAREAMEKGP